MIGITNSSIQLWLDFTGDTTPAIPPCQEKSKWSDGSYEDWDKILQADSCTSVCNDSGSLLDPTMPNNLVTCGLWASLTVMPYKTGDRLGDMNIEDQVNALLEPFVLLGLNHSDADYARIARYTVASGLSALYNRIMSDTYTGITSFASACAEQELFPYSRLDPMVAPNPTHSLQACIDAVCSSRTSNPDLGGIGVGSFQFSTRYPYTIL